MLKPVVLYKDDFESEENSVEAHIIFEESNFKTNVEIKVAGFGYDKLEATRQLIEGLNASKDAVDKLISFAAEVEKLQAEEEGKAKEIPIVTHP